MLLKRCLRVSLHTFERSFPLIFNKHCYRQSRNLQATLFWSKELILSSNSPNSVSLLGLLCSDFIVFLGIQHSPVSQKAKAYQFVEATSLGKVYH